MQSSVMKLPGSGKPGGMPGRPCPRFAATARFKSSSCARRSAFGEKTVRREDGGIERGVGGFERVRAGEFERAVEGAQAAAHVWERLGADAAHFAPGGGGGLDAGEVGPG